MTKNHIISYWNDYLQDVEEKERGANVIFSDILFFACGCKELPPLGSLTHVTVEFLHEPEDDGKLSIFPKANTCGLVLHLPVTHTSYETFKKQSSLQLETAKVLDMFKMFI